MDGWVGKEAIRAARRVNLYDFLLAAHPNDVAIEGDSLRLARDHSVSIKQGYTGFTDFATMETGNSIECLTRYFCYGFQDAVEALCGFAGVPIDAPDARSGTIDLAGLGALRPASPPDPSGNAPRHAQEPRKDPPRMFVPPEPVQGPYRRLYAYLVQRRGIPGVLIRRLIEQSLLYQDRDHGNAVFIDRKHEFAEVRGTGDAPFHGVAPGSDPSGFWGFQPRGPDAVPEAAYVCEAAIDAISLYLLLTRDPRNRADEAMYCSIGGVANRDRVEAIRDYMDAAGGRTVLAFDNDEAGEKWRQAHPDCRAAVPRLKDWNADWLDALAARPGT